MPITEKEMDPAIIEPDGTSNLTIKFVIPWSIRQGTKRNRLTINLVFSLYDTVSSKYLGSNLPCTIPL